MVVVGCGSQTARRHLAICRLILTCTTHHDHCQDGTVNISFTMGGNTDNRRGANAILRSLENSDASSSDYCAGYEKLLCFPYTTSSYDSAWVVIKVALSNTPVCAVTPLPYPSHSPRPYTPTHYFRVATRMEAGVLLLLLIMMMMDILISPSMTGTLRHYTHIRHHPSMCHTITPPCHHHLHHPRPHPFTPTPTCS